MLGNVTIDTRVTVSNKVTLVLTDGATLTIPKGISVPSNATLNICAYSTKADEMGSLTINNVTTNNAAGIGGTGGTGGTINISGGKISAKGGSSGAGIGGGGSGGGGIITISGGIVTATGGSGSAGIGGGGGSSNTAGGKITISGGTVKATGGSNGAGGTITISGGKVEATGGSSAMGIGGGSGKTGTGSLTVGFSDNSASLKANSYTALTVQTNKILTDGAGAFYVGTLTADERTAIKDKTLVKGDAYLISVSVTGTGGTVTSPVRAAQQGTSITLNVSPATNYVLDTLTYRVGSNNPVNIPETNGAYTFSMPAGDVTINAAFKLAPVATPSFSPAAGTYPDAQSVTISCETDGAAIYYTTDGTDPTTASTAYTTAISVSESVTIKAIAVKSGLDNSEIASAAYTIIPPTYNVTVNAGENMTKTEDSGLASQTGLSGSMTSVVYTANDGCYFPTDYSVSEVHGISVTRNSHTQITVSGTPTGDATIILTADTAKTKETRLRRRSPLPARTAADCRAVQAP